MDYVAILTGSPDHTILATDVETGSAIARLENAHESVPLCFVINQYSRMLILVIIWTSSSSDAGLQSIDLLTWPRLPLPLEMMEAVLRSFTMTCGSFCLFFCFLFFFFLNYNSFAFVHCRCGIPDNDLAAIPLMLMRITSPIWLFQLIPWNSWELGNPPCCCFVVLILTFNLNEYPWTYLFILFILMHC